METYFLMTLVVFACAAHRGQGFVGKVVSHPTDQLAIVGSPVSLSCSVTGGQVDRWLHRGMPVVEDDALEVSTAGDSSTLTLTAFSDEQSGEYRCQFSTDYGIGLSLPGRVRYFGERFSEDPKDFNSYVLINDSSNPNMRSVIAFDCSFEEQTDVARPRITWQRCFPNGSSAADIEETTEVFRSGVQDIPIYVFFQSGYTGFFQILDYLNEADYDGTSYRCKATSTIPGDASVAFSNCATVTFHSADVPVPSTLPTFRTVPKTLISLTEEDDSGVMACSIQRNDAAAPLQIITAQGTTVVEEFEFTPNSLPSTFGYEYIPKTNLQFNLTSADLDDQSYFANETYTCLLDGTEFRESTTFVRIVPIEKVNDNEVTTDTFAEGSVNAEISFDVSANSLISNNRVFKDGRRLSLDGTDTPVVQDSMSKEGGIGSHTLTIPTVTEEYEGIYQFEAENKAGIVVEYHRVAVKIKARAESASITLFAVISHDLEIDCKARGSSGDPELMIFTWTRNDQAVRIMGFGTDSSGQAMDRLIISNVTETDAGIYECHPRNPAGEYNFTAFTVQVVRSIDPPVIDSIDFISRPPNDSYVMVCWDPKDYPGVVIDHYEVELLLVNSGGAEVINSVSVPAWQTCINITVPVDGNRYAVRISAIGTGGIRLTDATGYTLVTEEGTVANIWWVIFLATVFGVIAFLTLVGVFVIGCLFVCPGILAAIRIRKGRAPGDGDLEERDGKGHAQRAPTPDSVSSI